MWIYSNLSNNYSLRLWGFLYKRILLGFGLDKANVANKSVIKLIHINYNGDITLSPNADYAINIIIKGKWQDI